MTLLTLCQLYLGANKVLDSACVSSIIRLYYSIQLKNTGDVTYTVVIMGFWTYAEIASCILCGCLPVMPKFFQGVAKNFGALSTGNSSFIRTILAPWTFMRSTQRSGSHSTDKPTNNNDSSHSMKPFNSPYEKIDEVELAERGHHRGKVAHDSQIFRKIDVQVSHDDGDPRLLESQQQRGQPWASKNSAV